MSNNKLNRRQLLKSLGIAGAGLGAASLTGGGYTIRKATAAQTRDIPQTPLKVAVVSFLSGPAAGPFGVPGSNAFKMCAEEINQNGGIAGRKIDLKTYDEAGGTDSQVKLARKLIMEEEVDVILGYISSADCKAILPMSDELGGLVFAYDCGTHVLMEKEKSPYEVPKYTLGFRTSAHIGIDGISLAKFIADNYPDVKKIAGINQDYAYGRDSWMIFEKAIKQLKPDVEVVDTLWPQLFNKDYTAHITSLINSGAEIIHSSMWGGDNVTFTKQAKGMGLFDKARMVFSRGEPYPQEIGEDYPEGQIVCCAGTHYFRYPPPDKWDMNKEFVDKYYNKYGKYPTYPCYHAYQAIYGYKAAVEKAVSLVGGWPSKQEISQAAAGSSLQTPSGNLYIAEDHNAREDCLVGVTKKVKEYSFPILDPDNSKIYPAHQINAPVGIKTEDWIDSWKEDVPNWSA